MRKLLADLPHAIRRWDETDPVLAAVARRHPPARRPLGERSAFAALAQSIVHQQVSLAAGRTIYGRLRAACGGRVAPQAVTALGPSGLKAAGISPQKQRYLLDLSQRCTDGALDFRRLSRADDADAIEALTDVRGIGRWTAEMFLLFHMQRPDVLAVDDLGLQIAVAGTHGVRRDRARLFLERQRAAWSPYGSLASLTLWDHRRAESA